MSSGTRGALRPDRHRNARLRADASPEPVPTPNADRPSSCADPRAASAAPPPPVLPRPTRRRAAGPRRGGKPDETPPEPATTRDSAAALPTLPTLAGARSTWPPRPTRSPRPHWPRSRIAPVRTASCASSAWARGASSSIPDTAATTPARSAARVSRRRTWSSMSPCVSSAAAQRPAWRSS